MGYGATGQIFFPPVGGVESARTRALSQKRIGSHVKQRKRALQRDGGPAPRKLFGKNDFIALIQQLMIILHRRLCEKRFAALAMTVQDDRTAL